MALTSRNSIVKRPMGGQPVGFVPDADGSYIRGDIVQVSTVNAGQALKAATDGDPILGVVMDESFDSTAANSIGSSGDIGNQKMLVWTGPGIVCAKVNGTPSLGDPVTSGGATAAASLIVATVGTHHVVGEIVNATAIDTDYYEVRLF